MDLSGPLPGPKLGQLFDIIASAETADAPV